MADVIPREFINLVLAKIDLVDLIHAQIPLRKKSGSNYFARCPFHNEKSASFSVSQPKQFYYCFGCGAHGNAIDFLMQHERLSFKESVNALAKHAGMEVPHSAEHNNKLDALPDLYAEILLAADFYYENLRKSKRAIAYLKNRNITGRLAKLFRLGYAPPGWSHLLDALGKTESDKKKLLDTGLIIHKTEGGHYDRFRDRIMFPIHDYRGRIIGFGGRIIDEGEPKYLNSPETVLFQKGHELYGLYQALKAQRKLERVVIVEGYMDVIALFQHDITYAVATLGTATTTHHISRLIRYTAEIIFCFDGDEAGRTAAWRALQVIFSCMQDSLQIRFLFLPEGEDPDSLVHKEGKVAFEQRLSKATSLSDFFFQTLNQQCAMDTMEGRARFATLALNQIKQLPATIFRNILLEELSKRARVDLNTLTQSSGKPAVSTVALQPPEEPKAEAAVKTKLALPIQLAMALLVQHPQLVEFLPQPLPQSTLPGQLYLHQLIEMIQKSPHITTGGLLEHWRGQKEEKFFNKLAYWQHMVPEAGLKNELLGAIRQIMYLTYDEEINRLLAKAAQEGLQDHEKLELSSWIAKKKNG